MSWVSFLAIYFLVWWLVLLMVLPWGVRTQIESGKILPGTLGSAPESVKILRIIFITTVISGFICSLIYLGFANEWIDMWNLPFGYKPPW
ncbi:MAG: DUF1467 family protein [Alphaproteobacteria bacterium]|nr:DUF1467 family protein [Alphaproteobacteria bacterium]